MAAKTKLGRSLWKGSKWFARKFWPKVEKRLASRSKNFFDKALKKTRKRPRPA